MPIDKHDDNNWDATARQIQPGFIHNLHQFKHSMFTKVLYNVMCKVITDKYPEKLGKNKRPITIIKSAIIKQVQKQLKPVRLSVQQTDLTKFDKWLAQWANLYYDQIADCWNDHDIGNFPSSYLRSMYFSLRDYKSLKLSNYNVAFQALFAVPTAVSAAMAKDYIEKF